MRKRAYAASRGMTWRQTATRYLAVFDDAISDIPPTRLATFIPDSDGRGSHTVPEVRTGHLVSMCDDTGILQHAVQCVADRSHGYCIDDNARALILACALGECGEMGLPELLPARFSAFIQNAWNGDAGRFRNFMSYGRCWLEECGSEDSHGRTLWALGECVRSTTGASLRRWAKNLFETALPAIEQFRSPRAWAFALLGIDAYCDGVVPPSSVARMRGLLADRLAAALGAVATSDWVWFEDELAYDNARLSQALIVTGMATANPSYTRAGLESLRWLMSLQTASTGCFRPVGTEAFGVSRQLPKQFDQQPVDAAATIAASLAAWHATCGEEWANDAWRAFRWFFGDNDLGVSLIDAETGACADGLHRDRRNENNGAESALSYLLGLIEIRKFIRDRAETRRVEPALALSA